MSERRTAAEYRQSLVDAAGRMKVRLESLMTAWPVVSEILSDLAACELERDEWRKMLIEANDKTEEAEAARRYP